LFSPKVSPSLFFLHEADIKGDLEDTFSKFDSNGDGTVDRSEFADVFAQLGTALDENELKDLFNELDSDKDGDFYFFGIWLMYKIFWSLP
jgi:Ca2+-binding EF-hand superfamily protein